MICPRLLDEGILSYQKSLKKVLCPMAAHGIMMK